MSSMFTTVAVVVSLFFTLATHAVSAQASSSPRGKNDMHEGVHFEVAFGAVWGSATESPLPQPFLLALLSLNETTVTVQYGLTGNRVTTSYQLRPGVATFVPMSTYGVLPSADGGIRRHGITVRSTEPITVSTFTEYRGNRAATLHYPVRFWGNSYHTFNYPQDEYGSSANTKRRPGQIVIVAESDATMVTVLSPVAIKSGPKQADTIPANTSTTIRLNAHEVLTLFSVLKPGYSYHVGTDLTGTRVTSNKPIAVLSGHTKGSVGSYAGVLPPIGQFAAEAHFVRNCYYQSMLPDVYADTAFVTVPIVYEGNREGATFNVDSAHVAGDVVRIIALHDNTIVRRLDIGGTSQLEVDTLKAGEYHTDLSVDRASYWTTSKPTHMVQYGKSWALHRGGLVQPVDQKNDDDIQGHATVEAGMPTMMIVPGISRWIRGASFTAPHTINDFVSIVVPTAHLGAILFNGGSLTDSVDMKPLNGTPFSFGSKQLSAGTHTLQRTNRIATFMAWSHGSLDGLAQGGAYGKPVGINLERDCNDEMEMSIERVGGHVVVSAAMKTPGTCASVRQHAVVSASNAVTDSIVAADTVVRYYLSRISADTEGTITLLFEGSVDSWIEQTVELDLTTNATHRAELEYKTTTFAKDVELVASITSFNTIPVHLDSCIVTMRFNRRELSRKTVAYGSDTTVADLVTTHFKFNILSHTAGTKIGQVAFNYNPGQPFPKPPTLVRIDWYDSQGYQPNIETIVNPVHVGITDAQIVNASPITPTLALSPQPAHDIVSIAYNMGRQGGSLRMPISARTLRVYDMTGALVMDLSDRVVGEEGTITVNMQALAKGLYVLQMSNGVHSTYVRAWLLK